jgi:DNA repair exonuclease SbcCD ATPase subunit
MSELSVSKLDAATEEPKQASTRGLTIAVTCLGAALVAGNVYFAQKADRLQDEIGELRTAVKSELITLQNGAENVHSRNSEQIAELRRKLDEAGAQSAKAVAQANITVKKSAEKLAQQIAATQKETKRYHQNLADQLGEMQQAATLTKEHISSVANDVTTVRTEVANARTEIEKNVSDLKSVRGDLGVQSGLIATNSRELAALRALGERDYVEFQLAKTKAPQRVGDIAIQLRKADAKRHRYTIQVIADDKRVEKKDRGVNEPVQFYMSKSRIPYEIVVNEVRQDKITGYLAAPKVKSNVLASQLGRP